MSLRDEDKKSLVVSPRPLNNFALIDNFCNRIDISLINDTDDIMILNLY